MCAIKAAFSWAYRYDLTDNHPFKGRGLLFETKPNRRAFTKDEINTLLEQTKGTNIGLVIRLTYYTGMRLREVVTLTWDKIHLGNVPYIRITADNTKSKSGRNIPLGKKALGAIEGLQEVLNKKKQRYPKPYENRSPAETYVIQKQRGWGQYQIRSVQDKFRKAMNQAGLPKELKFHCLRHAFATHILSKGGNLHGVSKIMGHSSPQVTSRFYDHTTALNFRETADLI